MKKLCGYSLRGHKRPFEKRWIRAGHENPAWKIHKHLERGSNRWRVAICTMQLGCTTFSNEQRQEATAATTTDDKHIDHHFNR